MMFSKTTPAVLATLLSGIAVSANALACATDGWDSTSGMVGVGQPFGGTDLTGVSRFEEFCAMVATGTGHVQTNAPSHSEVTNRVYVYPNGIGGTGSAKILVGYSGTEGSVELYSVAYDVDATEFVFTTGAGSQSAPAAPGWNFFEYHWDGTDFDFWVNEDATVDPPTGTLGGGGAATLESVQLGLPEGLGNLTGMFNFDTFQMNNTTAIGPVLNCDAESNGLLNFNDLAAMYNEQFGGILADGTPDCDSNGLVNFNDMAALYNILFP